jgi:hypothetical protein
MKIYYEIYNKIKFPDLNKLEEYLNQPYNFVCQEFLKFEDCFTYFNCIEETSPSTDVSNLFIVKLKFSKKKIKIERAFYNLKKYQALL